MRKIISILSILFVAISLQAQTSFLDFLGEIPCVKSRKVDYRRLLADNIHFDRPDRERGI